MRDGLPKYVHHENEAQLGHSVHNPSSARKYEVVVSCGLVPHRHNHCRGSYRPLVAPVGVLMEGQPACRVLMMD